MDKILSTSVAGPRGRNRFLAGCTVVTCLGLFVALAPRGLSQISEDRGFSPPAPLPPLSAIDAPLVFYPPEVPEFGGALKSSTKRFSSSTRDFTAPSALAAYVTEYFYPALGSRLEQGSLTSALDSELGAWQSSQAKLLNALRDQWELTHTMSASSREGALREFATAQHVKILALENSAERLRIDLLHVGLFRERVDWYSWRLWHLSDSNSRSPTMALAGAYQTARAVAYYQEGLTVEQRGLLIELAAELRQQARPSRRSADRSSDQTSSVYFLPALARIPWPATASVELRTELDAFIRDREILKTELAAMVRREDDESSSHRTRAFQELSQRQAEPFLALEKQAEQLRHELAALPPSPPPTPSYLPPELGARIETFRAEKSALDRELADYVARVRMEPPKFTRISDLRAMVQAAMTEMALRRQTAADTFRLENKDRFDELNQNLAWISSHLADFARTEIDPTTGQPYEPGKLLRNFAAAQLKIEQWGRDEVIYHDYKLAVLQPGFSPEQRRLLFSSAIVGLAQSLPDGELMPIQSPRF